MKIPNFFYMNNCKVMQELYKREIPAMKRVPISVGGENTIYIAIKSAFQFSYFDKIVCDAVYSIWQFHRNDVMFNERKKDKVTITPTEVIACMTGKENIRLRNEEKIVEILDRLSRADVAIIWEEEMKARNIEGIPSVIAAKMLPIERVEGGRKFKMNLSIGLPLYEYASAVHQMIRIPENMLSCGPVQIEDEIVIPALGLPNTDEVIQLKHILLQRIEMLKNEKNRFNNHSIRYYYPSHKRAGCMDGIFALMNIREEDYASASAWSNRKQTLHKQVMKILDYYCSVGYIDSYKDAGEVEGHIRRKGIVGVDIIC